MKRFARIFLTVTVLVVLSWASFAHAASFVVTRFDDPAPDGCNSGVDCSLREAVIAANAAGGTNDVQLGTGTYNLTIAENGGETGGSLDIDNSLTIQGQGAEATIINGVQPGLNSRIIEAFDGGLTIVLDGLTVQNGDSNGGVGGGILAASTSQTLTLSNCRVTNNIGGNGGGLYSNAQTLIQNCRFDLNRVESDTDGGGVYFGSSVGLVVENSTFDNNELPENGQGAGLFFENGSSLSISGSRFEANKLTSNGTGAGLHCTGNDPVTISNTVFTGNSIEGGGGAGAGLKCDPGTLLLDGVTFSQNTTDGGEYAAMYISGGTTANIRNSLIEGNRITAGTGRFPAGLLTTSSVSIENSTIRDNVNEGSGDGGGMWVVGSLTVVGSTFSGNQTNGNAGALLLTAAAINISNSTFSGNEAVSDGGAIHINTGNGTFNNVTISGNTATGLGGGVFFDNFVT
ncbi:MAG TPA: CSLREA domain-containing protein, partial [bacterium]|nr:CSLREA domain-containing protein [bacterium]